jgi:hypothetical protein
MQDFLNKNVKINTMCYYINIKFNIMNESELKCTWLIIANIQIVNYISGFLAFVAIKVGIFSSPNRPSSFMSS